VLRKVFSIDVENDVMLTWFVNFSLSANGAAHGPGIYLGAKPMTSKYFAKVSIHFTNRLID